MLQSKSPFFKKPFKSQKWKKYNADDTGVAVKLENGCRDEAKTYSHLFFKKYKLSTYLNKECNNIIQFGASAGLFLEDYNKKGWNVIGYDNCSQAITRLRQKKITCYQFDLNNIIDTESRLNQDIKATPINFIAIKLLQYLNEEALVLLIFALMDKAPTNSRYVIVNSISANGDYQSLPKNYVASFFGARTDMRVLLMTKTPEKLPEIPEYEHHDDEVLVVQKV